MGSTPSPIFEMSHLIALYTEEAGNVKTSGSISFPLQRDSVAANNPILNMDVDMDFKSKIAVTLDLGPTNPTKDFSAFPTYGGSTIPIYIDPGWLDIIVGGGVPDTQPAWGGQVLLKHLIVKCELGAVALRVGALDPFNDSAVNPPAEVRPFILQEGGIFAQSFNAVRPVTVVIDPGALGTHLTPFVQGVPSLTLDTFEALNRIRVLAFVERYN